MFRQRTDPALARARAAQRAPTLPSQASTGRVQEWYPAYANFPWENIERFLRQKWPYWTDFNPSKVRKPSSMITNANHFLEATDMWQFEVPARLTEVSAL
jgi:predicted RNase H-like nuclease